MQDRVRGINSTIQASKNNGNHNKTRLASIVTQVDLDRCDSFIEKVRQERFNKVKARQVRKFNILYNKNKQYQDSYNVSLNNNRSMQGVNADRLDNSNQLVSEKDINMWVINLSSTNLTTAQKAVLAKGPNYATSPNNIPNGEYIKAIESMCLKLKHEDAMELTADINSLLRKGKVPKTQLDQTRKNRIGTTQKG